MPDDVEYSQEYTARFNCQVRFIQNAIDNIMLDLPVDSGTSNRVPGSMRNRRV